MRYVCDGDLDGIRDAIRSMQASLNGALERIDTLEAENEELRRTIDGLIPGSEESTLPAETTTMPEETILPAETTTMPEETTTIPEPTYPPTSDPSPSPSVSPETSEPSSSPSVSPETSDPSPSPTVSPETSDPSSLPTVSPETSRPTPSPTVPPSSAPSAYFYEIDIATGTKCAWSDPRRTFRTNLNSVEECAERCHQDTDCEFFSFNTGGTNCIGCTSQPDRLDSKFVTYSINPPPTCGLINTDCIDPLNYVFNTGQHDNH